MLSYNELKPGIIFEYEKQPYQVLEAAFLRMQQRKPVMQTKIKNLLNGQIISRNFHQSDRGNTAQGGTKVAELETGAKVNVPLFINTGDTIRVNTDLGQYVERVEKK